jgi:hypothetical protein
VNRGATTFRSSLVIVALAMVPVLRGLRSGPPTELYSDAVQYVLAASNLLRYGTYNGSGDQLVPPRPDAYREPAFPLYLAGAMLTQLSLVRLPESLLFERRLQDDRLELSCCSCS